MDNLCSRGLQAGAGGRAQPLGAGAALDRRLCDASQGVRAERPAGGCLGIRLGEDTDGEAGGQRKGWARRG